jgi:CheY-like chemotaxis protein/HPt (histidine-containing phosphotransfer) domain-containing protein
MLCSRGHEVDTVEDGEAAVQATRHGDYDVVLMDVRMPVLDGLAATAEIRRNPSTAKLHVVAVTAHAQRDECLAAGMSGFVAKPFRPEELFRAVEQVGTEKTPETGEAGQLYQAPPVDIEQLREALAGGGVEGLLGSLLRSFLREAPAKMQAVEEAVISGDHARVDTAAHSLKSSAATLRARRLADILHQVECAGKAEDAAEARRLLSEVRAEYASVLEFVERVTTD